jgi:pimeloyl-ACP methyl ester carboxylesterase
MRSSLDKAALLICLLAALHHGAAQPPASGARTKEGAAGALDAAGEWEGALAVGAARVRLVLKVSKQADGKLEAKLDSPDQGRTDLPVSVFEQDGRFVRFEMASIGGSYDGALARDGSRIEGHWKQGGQVFPLDFKRAGPQPPSTATIPAGEAARGRVRLTPCNAPQAPGDALCARYEVFEDRASKRGRKINLKVVLLPALGGARAPDPVFYFVGGPGAAATQAAAAPLMTYLRRTRDVVFVDQRGTGESNRLDCDLRGGRDDMRGYFGEPFPPERVRACRAELEKIADLRLYTTPVAMADLDEVRDALGYERVNLAGGSYGSTAALAYLRLYPARVRSAAVFGVAPVDFKMALPFAKGVEHSLSRLFSDCEADEPCRAAFPKLREEFAELHARLAKSPAVFEATNPVTGQKQQLALTREALMEHVRVMLYNPNLTSLLPLLFREMHGGSYARFAETAYDFVRRIEGGIARGMHLSVTCSESFPFISDDEIERESAGTFHGDYRVRAHARACGLWPRGELPKGYRDAVKTDVPVLMISGDLDPVTPAWAAAAALPGYTRGRQIVIPNGTHSAYDCVDRLTAAFIERGTADGLDTACVDQIQRRPFVTALPPQQQRRAQ